MCPIFAEMYGFLVSCHQDYFLSCIMVHNSLQVSDKRDDHQSQFSAPYKLHLIGLTMKIVFIFLFLEQSTGFKDWTRL